MPLLTDKEEPKQKGPKMKKQRYLTIVFGELEDNTTLMMMDNNGNKDPLPPKDIIYAFEYFKAQITAGAVLNLLGPAPKQAPKENGPLKAE